MHARARRRLSRGIKKKGTALLKKLRKAKKDCGPYDKPDVVKTHLRDMLIMPEMIGSVIGVHNGKVFTSVEVKADMVCTLPDCTPHLLLLRPPRPSRRHDAGAGGRIICWAARTAARRTQQRRTATAADDADASSLRCARRGGSARHWC